MSLEEFDHVMPEMIVVCAHVDLLQVLCGSLQLGFIMASCQITCNSVFFSFSLDDSFKCLVAALQCARQMSDVPS